MAHGREKTPFDTGCLERVVMSRVEVSPQLLEVGHVAYDRYHLVLATFDQTRFEVPGVVILLTLLIFEAHDLARLERGLDLLGGFAGHLLREHLANIFADQDPGLGLRAAVGRVKAEHDAGP